jgi:hypothetical protein
VYKILEKTGNYCLNADVTTTSGGVQQSMGTQRFYAHLNKLSSTSAEFILQTPALTPQKTPDGGMYYLVADISEKSSTKTELVLYKSNLDASPGAANAIKLWVNGKTDKCQKFKGESAFGPSYNFGVR